MPADTRGAAEAVLDYIDDWERRYYCPAPTAALCYDLRLSQEALALILARLETAGRMGRVRGPLGALDVRVCR